MSRWGNIGRPLIILITVALVSMTAVSSLLVYTSQQTTEARVELVSSQTERKNLENESIYVANSVGLFFERTERILEATAESLNGATFANESLQQTIQVAKSSVSQYSDELVWLDSKGSLVYTTRTNSSDVIGSDLSGNEYYELPLATNHPAIVPVHNTNTNAVSAGSFAISVPITGRDGSFNGVLAVILPVDFVKQRSLEVGFDKDLILISNDGRILLHPSNSFEGLETIGPQMALHLTEDSRNITLKSLQLMTEGRSGITEYNEKNNQGELMAYAPVTVKGIHIWSVGLLQTAPTSPLFTKIFEERQNFTIVGTGLVATISGIFIIFILVLNRRLFATVSRQDTKIRNNLQDLQTAYERLKEQEVIKDEFINIAAHELRTPVLPIVLSAENLADRMPEDENIKVILRNANRITKLTNDILDVSRIESNTLKLQKQKVNIKNLVEEVIQDARLKLLASENVNIALESSIPPTMEDVSIDRSRINQVLVNLVDNAINFTENGTIRVLLEPDKETRGHLRISVLDQGKGIDPSIQGKLFGKFVTKSDRAKGTGLGLYLCKAIVESHGGTIRGENNSTGKGATFTLTLPAI